MKQQLIYQSQNNLRIDKFLSQKFSDLPRNLFIQKIKEGFIKVNGNIVKPSFKLKENDIIDIDFIKEEEPILEKIDYKLDIVYEDRYIAVINKPKGLVCHPASSFKGNTLVNYLLSNFKNLSNIDSKRPGIVHRLDKDTTGLIIITKTDQAYLKYQKLFQNHKIKKTYNALVEGKIIKTYDEISTKIKRSSSNKTKMSVSNSGKDAISIYKVLETTSQFSLVEINILTGRTHQIRTHMSYLNHPLYGDIKYGSKAKSEKSFYLTAKKLEFQCPFTDKNIIIEIDLPFEFLEKLKSLGFKNINKKGV